MKKTLSLLLAVLLLICVMPFSAFASDITVTGELLNELNYVLPAGSYVIPEGVRILIPDKTILYLEAGCSLYVKGTLDIYANENVTPIKYGSVISRGGDLTVCCWEENGVIKAGNVTNSKYVYGNETPGNFHYFAQVYIDDFPDMDAFYLSLIDRGEPSFDSLNPADNPQVLDIQYAVSNNWDDEQSQVLINEEKRGVQQHFTDLYATADRTGHIVSVPLNQYLYLRVRYINTAAYADWLAAETEADKKDIDFISKIFDASGFGLIYSSNGVNQLCPQTQGFFTVPVSSAGKISFTTPTGSIRKEYSVYIPNDTGYKTFQQSTGITSDSNNTIHMKYGDSFTFRVTVDKDYTDSQSMMRVYMIDSYKYNEEYMEAFEISDYEGTVEFLPESDPNHNPCCYIDENGLYHITDITGDFTVVVKGLVKNETLSLVGNIVEMFKSFVQTINQVLDYFRQIFHIV